MDRSLPAAALLAVSCLSGQPAAADEAQGSFLAGLCAACHQSEAPDPAFPSIVGMDEARFRSLMQDYRSGARDDAVMQAVAISLSDEEIAALARYMAARGQPQ
jgi:cytochrome c553